MTTLLPAQLTDLADDLRASGTRQIVGIAGPPGVGKSTVAAALAERIGSSAVVVPLDGFHLADDLLTELGLRSVKGAPETFDARGFVALIERLRSETDTTVYAPAFDRTIENPIAGSIPVAAEHTAVIVEGNYLLMDGPWQRARASFDHTMYLALDPAVRVPRLIQRHIDHGRTPAEAKEWVERTDEANARLIDATKGHADLVVELDAIDEARAGS